MNLQQQKNQQQCLNLQQQKSQQLYLNLQQKNQQHLRLQHHQQIKVLILGTVLVVMQLITQLIQHQHQHQRQRLLEV
ncbi:hypothetical protein D356_02068 [Enterococcus faecium SD2A-2]|uniref:Uncharacterized protein n=1 Tax=Enterococcus faecium SD2A-2 TaxID=1244154 RepID=A0AB73A9R9_ENTFC|nr:hypothetical protein D356_02068 [Enterococcus faecium SD2A-2]